MRNRKSTFLIAWIAGTGIAAIASAQPSAGGPGESIDADPAFNQLVTALVLNNIPHTWERNRGWGDQVERWDGIKWERDGLRISSHRRRKLVNDGTWRKYSATLAEPREHFRVEVTNMRAAEQGRLAFRASFAARLNLFARQALWARGVQLYSVSAEGQATVQLHVDVETAMRLEGKRFPPDIVFEPRVTAARLQVEDFRIDRVSKLGGEFAQQVTRLARRELDEKIAEKERELVSRLNADLEEDAGQLRISLSSAASSRWTESALPFLAPPVRHAVDQLQR